MPGSSRPSLTRALSPWTYLLRNLRRVAPVFAIQALVTTLLVLTITPTNAFEATARAKLKPMEIFTLVRPRSSGRFSEELLALLDANPAQARRTHARMLAVRTPMIVGEDAAPLIALPQDVWADFLEKVGVRLTAGSLPEPGTNEVVLHRAIVEGRGMRLSDEFGQQLDPESATPGRFRLAGILEGASRIGLADHGYVDAERKGVFLFVPRVQVVYARPAQKDASDAYLHAAKEEDGDPAFRVIDHAYIEARIASMLENLPMIIGFITFSVGIVVALVIALLNVIAFQTRVDEFAVYLSVGHRRARLVRKLAIETGAVAVLAWACGFAVGLAGVALYRDLWLAPRGIVLALFDVRPLLFSLSVPVLSTLTGAVALGHRLRRMDPVAVIQRRGGA